MSPKVLTVSTIALVVVFGLGILVGYSSKTIPPSNKPVRVSGYQYVKPLLLCNLEPQPQNEDKTIESKLQTYINSSTSKDVGVYFINPAAGTWGGVNYNESFSPASMLKVPIMTALFHVSESDPAFLSKSIYYDGSFDLNAAENIKPTSSIQPNHSYSINDLITYMIKYSDNNAEELLLGVLPAEELSNIFTDLGLAAPSSSGPIDFMSPKAYSLFLRVLYNGSYLSHDLSEKALELMAYRDFPNGLQAGVPQDVDIAEKFGDRRVVDNQGNFMSQEIHDCGIVYSPKGDYFLCVMTRGKDISTLESEISEISKLVYQYINQ